MFGIRKLKEQVSLMDEALYDIARDAAIALHPPKFEVGDRVRFNMTSSIDDQGYIGRIVVRNRDVLPSRSVGNKYKSIVKYGYVIVRDGDECIFPTVSEWQINALPTSPVKPQPRPKSATLKKGRTRKK